MIASLFIALVLQCSFRLLYPRNCKVVEEVGGRIVLRAGQSMLENSVDEEVRVIMDLPCLELKTNYFHNP